MSLLTVTGDGTLRAENPVGTVYRCLGSDVDDAIAAAPYLPFADIVAATLAYLPMGGDLAPYGWRIGVGEDHFWRAARDERRRAHENAQIEFFGYEGELRISLLGPLSLATATHLGTGERLLADSGAVRELPAMLAEGAARLREDLATRLPGARITYTVWEPAFETVCAGAIPTASGYRRYQAIPREEALHLLRGLTDSLAEPTVCAPRPLPVNCPVGIDPLRLGRLETPASRNDWELVASLRDAEHLPTLLVDPQNPGPAWRSACAAWRELGFAVKEMSGLTLMASKGAHSRALNRPPLAERELREADLAALLRAAPYAAEELSG
ncbi:hypothetical protein ACUH9H_01065 [Dermabacteraceae bacterium P13128]